MTSSIRKTKTGPTVLYGGEGLPNDLISVVEQQKLFTTFSNSPLIKKDPYSEVRCLQVNNKPYFAKFYRDKNFVGKLKRLCKKHRSWNVFCVARAMRENAVLTPNLYGYVQVNNGAFVLGEWLQDFSDMRIIEDMNNAEEFLLESNLLFRVSDALVNLHDSGFYHGDMKWGNILFHANNPDIYLVDLDGTKQSTTEERFSRDVARFVFCLHEGGFKPQHAQIFLDTYCEKRKIDKSGFEILVNNHLDGFKQKRINAQLQSQ